ncbi:MAG: PspC domain-containing protein [Pseudomonadota bacterium]
MARHHHSNGGRRHRRGRRREFNARKQSGWGMNLYRNTRDGKVAGVAAGLADHWDIAHWVMRLIWIGGFLFTGTLALWAYLACWILLAPVPGRRAADRFADQADWHDAEEDVAMEYDEFRHSYRPRNVFRYSEGSSVRLKRARERLDAALRRVEDMESYVTSRQYELNKEFSRL